MEDNLFVDNEFVETVAAAADAAAAAVVVVAVLVLVRLDCLSPLLKVLKC